MAWNKTLENPAHTKSTCRSYEKWIVFFSFLIHWTTWRMTKNSSHPLVCLCCFGDAESASFSERFKPLKKTRVLFPRIKGWNFHVYRKKHSFYNPHYFRSQFIWMLPSNIFHTLYNFSIFIHLSTPDCEFFEDKTSWFLLLLSLIYQIIALHVWWASHYTKYFLNIITHLILITALWFRDYDYLYFSD